MEHQKKIAVINDFSGFGRCSLTVSLPIISAMGIQCCCVPTAILSNHTGYEDYFFDDYTSNMEKYFSKWVKLGLEFDGIYTGFLGSTTQIEIVNKFIKIFKGENTIVITDPVMGDNGRLYDTFTNDICIKMRELCENANVITPNLTEACFLTGIDYKPNEFDKDKLIQIAQKLSVGNVSKVAITGIVSGDEISNFVYEKNLNETSVCTVSCLKIGDERAGTGDVFSSIIAGDIINGDSFVNSVLKASRFISKATEKSKNLNIPKQDGICFEYFLKEL